MTILSVFVNCGPVQSCVRFVFCCHNALMRNMKSFEIILLAECGNEKIRFKNTI